MGVHLIVASADDDRRIGMELLAANEERDVVTTSAADLDGLLALVGVSRPDVIAFDLGLSDEPSEVVHRLHALAPTARLVAFGIARHPAGVEAGEVDQLMDAAADPRAVFDVVRTLLSDADRIDPQDDDTTR